MNHSRNNDAGAPVGRDAAAPAPISAYDLLLVFGLAVLLPVAWLLPVRYWARVGRLGVGCALPLFAAAYARRHRAHVEAIVGSRQLACGAGAVLPRSLSRNFEDTLLALRCHRPGAPMPVVHVEGAGHLQRAIAAGRGVVLWVSYFHFYNLVSKCATAQLGVPVSHLSHPRHGFSGTRFGMRWLNWIRTGIEDRCLRERVYLAPEGASAALERLRQRLGEGGVVSVTARTTGSNPVRVPFLDGELPCAVGAPLLAHQTGAALLPLHTLQTEDGRFLVQIDAPIAVDQRLSRREAILAAAAEYARRLEPVALRYPDQWKDWMEVAVAAGDVAHRDRSARRPAAV